MPEKISLSATAQRMCLLEKREKELRSQMMTLCSQYGNLTQELFIIMEAIKIELGDEMKKARSRSEIPNLFSGYLVD